MSDPTPDCFHCKHGWNCQVETIDQNLQCHIHQISLAFPIRAFCSRYEDGEGSTDYLANALAPTRIEELQHDKIYLWLPSHLKYPQEHGEKAFQVHLLTTVADYDGWTRERFLEEVATRAERIREDYRKRDMNLTGFASFFLFFGFSALSLFLSLRLRVFVSLRYAFCGIAASSRSI